MKKFFEFLLYSFFTLFITNCSFFNSVGEEIKGKDYNSQVTNVVFDKKTINIVNGESELLNVILNPNNIQGKCNVTWEYDNNFLSINSDNFGALITAIKPGSTYIKAKCNGIIATCLIFIAENGEESFENPYIYSNYSVIELQPSNTMTVNASLLGGSVSDMENFTWEIKNPEIADISPARNNCIISAKKPGSTQLVCSHPNSEYDYTFVVYVYKDKLTETYITTDYNIFTINKNELSSKLLTVDLVNPINAAYKNGFSWRFSDEKSKEVISLNANLNTAEIVPIKSGIARIIVSHENSQYDLEIIIRVTSIVKNTYVNVTQSSVLIDGSDTPITIHASLENYEGYVNPGEFVWEIPESSLALADCQASGNSLTILGKKNGTFKVSVGHKLSEYKRNILVILQNQIGSAIDASMYITTDQNYIQTQVGKEPTTINVRLIGGEEGVDNISSLDTENFNWYLKDGRNNSMLEVQAVHGVVKDINARSVKASESGNSCIGQLIINPIREGEVTIVVTHPRCLYDKEIKVKIFSESALVNPKTINTEDSLIRLLNGDSKEVTAILRNHTEGEQNNIQWSSSNPSNVSVSPTTGVTTVINACGTGNNQTYVTAHLDGALADKKILVLTADTAEELASMKGIYSDTSYLRISSGETKTLKVEGFGLDSIDRVTWTSTNNSIVTVNADSSFTNCTQATVTGISSGNAQIKASVAGSKEVIFEVTVLKQSESSEVFDENAGYLTTNKNAIVLETVEESDTLFVSGINISTKNMKTYTNWTMQDLESVEDNSSVFSLVGTPGDNVTITANRPGKTNITVTNKFSENSLNINVKCGELYEWTDNYIVYITTEKDVVNIVNGESTTISCALVNTNQNGSFSWQVTQGSENVEITGLASGTCNIKGINPGQAIITVSNSLAGEITKEILVNVANNQDELKGFKYLTTTQNVITVGEKNNISVNVEIKNANNVLSGYTWRSTDTNVASVVGSGSVAVVYGLKEGTAKIIVENHEHCNYPLELIVNVVDPIAASNDPYITCNSIVTCTVGSDNANILAELIGGTDADKSAFNWAIVDSSIAQLHAMNDNAQIKALKEGVTQVVISHPKATVNRTVLIICEPKITTNCYISLTESIIKMSPSDDARTITATLVNGEADDIYDFKWWADSYEKIDMNYTGNSCLIKPIASGTVTIHITHPKAANQKDIVLYISKYSDFAFETKSLQITTGQEYFVNMQVPATGVDCDISYESNNNDVCTVWGNNSVCILKPGVLENSNSSSCTIRAKLLTKGGAVQATAELLVSVTKKDETKPYIALQNNMPTIINMNRGEKRNISARIFGNSSNPDGESLIWKINDSNIAEFVGSKNYGSSIQLNAINSGKTVITIEDNSKEAKNPLTVYLIVAGVSDPTVTLNYSTLTSYIGEDNQTLVATVQNDTGEELVWNIENITNPNEEVDYFTMTTKGTKAYLIPQKPGKAKVSVTIPSNNSTASCIVDIREPEKIAFFVYDDESKPISQREKRYISSFQLYPGESKPIHFETIPEKDSLKDIWKSDNSYFDVSSSSINNPYITSWTNPITGITYEYPENIGTFIITGKAAQGIATLRVTTSSLKQASVSISNSYNYLLSVNKTMINESPKDVYNNKKLLYVNYEIRPACSELVVTNLSNADACKNLTLLNDAEYDALQNKWTIKNHEITQDSSSSGVVKGTLKFSVDGEVNTSVSLMGINRNVISNGGSSIQYDEFGHQNVKIKVAYQQHTFKPKITFQAPYANYETYKSVYNANGKHTSYSYYDESTNTIFLGDGEYLSGTIDVNLDKEPYSKVQINSVTFNNINSGLYDKTSMGKKQYEYVEANHLNSANVNSIAFELFHKKDYAIYQYRTSSTSSWTKASNGIDNMHRLKIESDKFIEVLNETIKEKVYVGNIVIKYTNYAQGKGESSFQIPVYVEVRNSPCTTNDDYYQMLNAQNINE